MPLCADLVFLLLIVTTSVGKGAVFPTQGDQEKFVNFVNQVKECHQMTGLTLAVVKEDESWTKGFGTARMTKNTNVPVDESHRFALGGTTKAFTSALISILAEKKGYTWDTTIKRILGPGFRLKTADLTNSVTLKDVLAERTGLLESSISLMAGSTLTRRQHVGNLRYLPVSLGFREEWSPSSHLFAVTADVVSKMSGHSFGQTLRSLLLSRLGMSDTGVLGEDFTLRHNKVAKPYVKDRGRTVLSNSKLYRPQPWESAVGLYSSARDMAKWMQMLIKNGQVGGSPLLNQHRLREMMTNATKARAMPGFHSNGHGLGWSIIKYKSHRMVYQFGTQFAYSSSIAILPQLKMGFFAASNGPDGTATTDILQKILMYFSDIVHGDQPEVNVTEVCKPEAYTPYPCENTQFDSLNKYVGKYKHRLFGEVEVKENKNGLYLTYGNVEGQLCKDKDGDAGIQLAGGLSYYYARWGAAAVEFHSLKNGKYQRVKIGTGWPDTTFTRTV